MKSQLCLYKAYFQLIKATRYGRLGGIETPHQMNTDLGDHTYSRSFSFKFFKGPEVQWHDSAFGSGITTGVMSGKWGYPFTPELCYGKRRVSFAGARETLGLWAYKPRPWMSVARRLIWYMREDGLEGLAFNRIKRADALVDCGRAKQALACYEEAEQLYLELVEEETRWRPGLAIVLSKRGDALVGLGRATEALACYEEAGQIYRELVEAGKTRWQPDLAVVLSKRGDVLVGLGRTTEAVSLYQRSLSIREKALGPEHLSVAENLNNLANLYDAQGLYAEAEPLLKRSLTILEKALGPEHPDVVTALENYAELLRKIDREPEAVTLESRAQAIRTKRNAD